VSRRALAGALVAVLPACGPAPGERVLGGDPEAGARVIARVQCGVCHDIPGVPGARGIVGPPLGGFARRAYNGGVVPNQPAELARWIRNAPSIAPDTGMPALPLDEREARDAAAYLYTLS
jgi:mono/diheme cytochrome c family protein